MATLHMVCGKIASGKSTFVARLGAEPGTLVVSEDAWLAALYGDEMIGIADFVRYSARLRAAMGPHIADLLDAGVSVALDFQANTVEARGWMRGILDRTGSAHVLHHLDVPDAVCLERLHARNATGDHPFAVGDAEFERITRHFAPPGPGEGFKVVVHRP